MKGFGAFFRKELAETLHTWRIWVVPGVIVFSAVSSPLLVYLTPMLADKFGSGQQGVIITATTPTAVDSYVSYLGNLVELVALAIVVAYGGLISGELRGGPGVLALTKPLSRPAFVLAKWLAQLTLIVVAGIVGYALCVVATVALFSPGPVLALLAAIALWLAFATVLLSAMALLSVVLRAPAAASGAGVGVYAALVVLGQFHWLAPYTPAGLSTAGTAALHGQPVRWAAALLSAAVVAAVCLAAAVWRFRRREI